MVDHLASSSLLCGSEGFFFDHKKDLSKPPVNQPISLVDFIKRQQKPPTKNTTTDFARMVSPKPCIKNTALSSSSSHRNRPTCKQQSVSFAVNKDTNQVWCMIREFEKEEPQVLKELFWSSGELHDNFSDDSEELRFSKERDLYKHALAKAYKASAAAATSSEHIDIDFESLASCGGARGMELEIYPIVQRFAKKHRRAVLVVQDTLREEKRPMYDDLSQSLIRKVSIKYSRPVRMVATRLAEFDKRGSLISEDDVSVDETYAANVSEEELSLTRDIMQKSESAMASYAEFQHSGGEPHDEEDVSDEEPAPVRMMQRSEPSFF